MAGRAADGQSRTDAFTLGVLRSLLESIPLEMAEVLKRTSYHPIFNEVLDFSTALLGREGRLIASSMGVTVHLGALELSAKAIIDHFGEEASGARRRAHPQQSRSPAAPICPTWTSSRPCTTRASWWPTRSSRGHHGDIGGMHPGSFAGDTVSIFQEGVRIPPIKLYERACSTRASSDLFLANVRVPQFSWGDLQAQVAGCRLGARRIGSCSTSTARRT